MAEKIVTKSLKEIVNFTKKQLEATSIADSHKYTLFGGSAGPGKSYWLRWYMVRTLIKWGKELNLKHIHAAMFCEDYPTLKDRQISKMEVEFPSWLGKVKDTKTDGLCFFVEEQFGGHVLMLRNLDDPSKYLSSEFAMIGVDELTMNEEMKFHRLRSRLRWTGVPEPKFVAATNPGGVGHEWVKKYFVDRDFPTGEKEGEKFAYVPARPTDNPHLAESYISTLQSLPEKMRKAYLDGNWDVFEGMFFTEWDPDIHTCEPFEIPDNWPRVRGIDPSGRSGTTSSHLYALAEDGTVYVTHEHYKMGMDTDEHAREIVKMSEGKDIKYTVIDMSAFSKLGMPESQAEIFERYGVLDLVASDKRRIPGWNVVHTYLRPDPVTGQPRLKIFKNCVNMIRTIPLAMHDDNNPEDVKSFWEGAEHLDALDECLIGDTLITTDKGEVKIKDIQVGDMVLTREGFREVLKSWMTNKEADIYTLKTSNGKTISGTANHPIWVDNKQSFLQLHELRYGDILSICNQKSSYLIKSDTLDIQIQKGKSTKNTILEMVRVYIERFGNFIEEKFPRVIIYTTKMVILLITPLKILSAKLKMNIFQNILFNGIKTIRKNLINIWMKLGDLLKNGMEVRKVKNGIVKEEGKIGKLGNLYRKFVTNVERYFKTLLDIRILNSVLINVNQNGEENLELMMKHENVSCAEKNLLQTSIVESYHVQKDVVYVMDIKIEKERQSVYNIMVKDTPEYYANGILVHNCRYVLQTLREQQAPVRKTLAEKKLEEYNRMETEFNNYNYGRNYSLE